jgi:vacuolar protein sorting-associated protein 13A/C
MKIPWNNLKGAPVRILIKDLFVLAAPKPEKNYDAKEEEELELKHKREMLETLEMLAVKTPRIILPTVIF